MNVRSEQMRLLDDIYRQGPKFITDARRAHGDNVVDLLIRKREVRRYRLPEGWVLTLGSRPRRERGLHPNYTSPSPDSLRQQVARGKVISALEARGYVFREHRNPYLSLMADPNGRATLIAINHKGYSSRSLRRLVGESLFRELLRGTELLIVDPNAERLKNAAQDHQHLFTLESLDRITKPPAKPN